MGSFRTVVAVAAVSVLALAGCSSDESSSSNGESGQSGSTQAEGYPKEVTDARGTVTIESPPEAIVATDNRVFRTLDAWGVELVAAPVPLVPDGVSYKTESGIIDLGSHNEPNLEGFVEAQPDLVLNGMRFGSHYDAIQGLVPDAALIDTTIDIEANPLDEELKRQMTLLGEVLGHEDDAQALNDALDEAVAAAEGAYNSEETVMGVITSGGNIGYAAPGSGRAVGPLFDLLGWTPSLEQEGTDDHQGDDISVEAIAASNPDWIIVLDRDAATASDEEGYQPAEELIEQSEALQNVTAVQEGNIIYLEAEFYVTEDIQAYTDLLNQIAEAMGS